MRQSRFLIAGLFLAVAVDCLAGSTWTAGAGTSNWATAANWSDGVPDSADDVLVNANAAITVGPQLTTGTYSTQWLRLGINGADTTAPPMTVSGGTLLPANIHVGETAGKTATLNVSGSGDVNSAGYILAGENGKGYINVTGGNLTCIGSFIVGRYSGSQDNVVTISGGHVTVNIVNKGFYIGYTNSTSGTLNISGDGILEIQNTGTYVSLGQSAGSTGNLNMTGGQIIATNATLYIGNGGTSTALLSGGTIRASTLSISTNSVLLINNNGALVLTGDKTSLIAAYVAANKIRTTSGKTIKTVFASGVTTVTAIPNATPNLTQILCTDAVTGRQYHAVGLGDENICHFYFTNQTWTSDSTKLILTTNIDAYKRCDYVMFNTVSGTTTYLDQDIWDANVLTTNGGVVSSDDHLYYHKYINSGNMPGYFYDIDLSDPAFTRSLLVANPDGYSFAGTPSISNDGTIGVCGRDSSGGLTNLFKINTSTATITKIVNSAWTNANLDPPAIDHIQVNPVYDDIFFFCHNYDGQIDDRIWTYQEPDLYQNLYQQQFLSGNLGEYVGHEMWAHDGEKLYFVKYSDSPIKPTGIFWVDAQDGNSYGVINGARGYLHNAVSPDGNWAVVDTVPVSIPAGWQSDIYLIDLNTKKSKLLARTAQRCLASWDHAHPSFSPDSQKVTFAFADVNNINWVGYMDISDIEIIKGGSSASVLRNEPCDDGLDFEFTTDSSSEAYTTEANIGNWNCRKIAGSKKMCFDVNDVFVKEGDGLADNDVVVELSYYDNGTDQIKLEYNAKDEGDPNTTNNYDPVYLTKTGTSIWKTQRFWLENAEFRNTQHFNCDFRINTNNDSSNEEWIKDVTVYPTSACYLTGDNIQNKGLNFYLITDPNSVAYSEPATIDGRSCRKIRYAYDDMMLFKADDFYVDSSARHVVMSITYYDIGTDYWKLQYNSTSSPTQGWSLHKQNSLTWKTQTIDISNARFNSNATYGNDFRIHTNGDGDEYIAAVKVYTAESYCLLADPDINIGLTRFHTNDPNAEAYNPVLTINGSVCRQIYNPQIMYFNVDDEYVTQADHDVSIKISYLDSGNDYLRLDYNTYDANYTSVYVQKNNTGYWRTCILKLHDACFRNAQSNQCDFSIHTNADGSGNEYIREVKVYLNGN